MIKQLLTAAAIPTLAFLVFAGGYATGKVSSAKKSAALAASNKVSTLTEIPTNVLIMQLSDSEMAAFQAWRKRRQHTTNDWPNGKMPVKVDRALTNWSFIEAKRPH